LNNCRWHPTPRSKSRVKARCACLSTLPVSRVTAPSSTCPAVTKGIRPNW
tara:strand:+ start:81971 stop:82120 length:150 start_codon:yes stop_codon:yes gene_type:complete